MRSFLSLLSLAVATSSAWAVDDVGDSHEPARTIALRDLYDNVPTAQAAATITSAATLKRGRRRGFPWGHSDEDDDDDDDDDDEDDIEVITETDPFGPTPVWVDVGKDGHPKTTATPEVVTLDDGSLSLTNAPPYEVTGTSFLRYKINPVVETTRRPAPTKGKAGAFARCYREKPDEDGGPFCHPEDGAVLYHGKTYYFIWDPDYFVMDNANPHGAKVIRLRGVKVNGTTGEELGEAFETDDNILAKDGFIPFKLEKKHLHEKKPTNISITIVDIHNGEQQTIVGPTIQLMKQPARPEPERAVVDHTDLYIALPIVLFACSALVIGSFWYNRASRHLNVGNVMGSSRFAKQRQKQMKRSLRKDLRQANQEEDIQLLAQSERDRQTWSDEDDEGDDGAFDEERGRRRKRGSKNT